MLKFENIVQILEYMKEGEEMMMQSKEESKRNVFTMERGRRGGKNTNY